MSDSNEIPPAVGAAGAEDDLPYRVVDENWQGYLRIRGTRYVEDTPEQAPHEYEQLRRVHRLRPVLPISDPDSIKLGALLAAAGRKAAASTLAAVFRTSRDHYPAPDHPSPLRAGRHGSWEAESFNHLAWQIGCELNGKPRRLHEPATFGITSMINRWVTDPARYTEVAATLAERFSTHTDLAGGWAKVADQWLQPDSRVRTNPGTLEQVVNYLLATADCRRQVADAVWTDATGAQA